MAGFLVAAERRPPPSSLSGQSTHALRGGSTPFGVGSLLHAHTGETLVERASSTARACMISEPPSSRRRGRGGERPPSAMVDELRHLDGATWNSDDSDSERQLNPIGTLSITALLRTSEARRRGAAGLFGPNAEQEVVTTVAV